MLRSIESASLQSVGTSGHDRLSPMLLRLADGSSVNTGLGLGVVRHTTGHVHDTLTQNNGYLAMKPTLDAVIASLSK